MLPFERFDHTRCGRASRQDHAPVGHSSKAIHQAYAKGAKVICPSLEEYEKKVIPLPSLNVKPESETPVLSQPA